MRAPLPPRPANLPAGVFAAGTSFLSTVLAVLGSFTVTNQSLHRPSLPDDAPPPLVQPGPHVRVVAVKDADRGILLRTRSREHTLGEFADMHACGGVPMALVVELDPAVQAEEAAEILRALGPAFREFRFVPRPAIRKVKP